MQLKNINEMIYYENKPFIINIFLSNFFLRLDLMQFLFYKYFLLKIRFYAVSFAGFQS